MVDHPVIEKPWYIPYLETKGYCPKCWRKEKYCKCVKDRSDA